MDPNHLTLGAVATVAATGFAVVKYIKVVQQNRTLHTHINNVTEITPIVIEQCDLLADQLSAQLKVNDMLLHQNKYLTSLLDQNDVPVTEFDRIAMTYPLEVEE